jgi:hypothetical protein
LLGEARGRKNQAGKSSPSHSFYETTFRRWNVTTTGACVTLPSEPRP